jgi:16S rRNA (guanine(1405)-N(7))-methyltransferase
MPVDLGVLLHEVHMGAKYAHIAPGLVRRIAIDVLTRQPRITLKDAIRETRNKLHQIGGLYLPASMPYDRWLRELQETDDRPAVLRRIMAAHTSTRERLPQIETFFKRVLADIPPPARILDVACGLNPLCVPWMPLAANARYHACDIYADKMAFLGKALALLGLDAHAELRDVIANPPDTPVDVAFVLKTVPCLEQVDKQAGARLLDTIDARHIVLSYPTRGVGGKDVGMSRNYAAHFDALMAGRAGRVTRFDFDNELVFRIDREES